MDNMLRLFAVIWLYLSRICLAQNSSLPKDCSVEIKPVDEGFPMYNSTRTAPSRFIGQSAPWYITATVTDRRAPNLVFGDVDTSQELSVFISVPRTLVATQRGRDSRVCPYMMKAVNKTSENPPDMDTDDDPSFANHSCKGVISDKCIKEFENSTLAVGGGSSKCPSLQSFDLSEECKEHLFIGQTVPRNFSSARCSVDEMPYLDLPENYTTFGSGLWVGLDGDKDRGDFDLYDLRVQQTIPLLFSVSTGAGMSRMICMAPDQVVSGSRKPELKLEGADEEDENMASRVGGLGAAVFLSVGAMIFSLL